MSWIDVVSIVIIVVCVAVQSRRGFLQSLFDFLACLISLGIMRGACSKMEGMGGPLTVFFLIFGALLVASYFLYNMTAFTLDAYDPVLGFLFGLMTACAIIWALYWSGDTLRLDPSGVSPDWILDSRFSDSLYHYRWWKGFLDFMSKLGEYD